MNNKNFWNYEDLGYIHIELSNLCNAACPNCPRYWCHTEVVQPELDLSSISLEQFKSWFDVETVKKIKRWLICGTNGDPMMAKDVYEILEYICSNNDNSEIQINTNGGTRSEEFWTKLGNLFAKTPDIRRFVIFSVDGLEDTNHIYRRNVKWDVVLRNMKAYASTGAKSQWDYLIFKHNEHQIEEAKKLANEIGIREFALKRALGFETRNPNEHKNLIVRDKEGNFLYWIEPPSPEYRNLQEPIKFLDQPNKKINPPTKKVTQEQKIEFLKYSMDRTLPDHKFPEFHKNKHIRCKSKEPYGMEIYIDATGNVMPCCYVGTWFNASYSDPQALQLQKSVMDWGLEKVNLKNYSLKEILNSDYLEEAFAKKWETAPENERMTFCFEICGHLDDNRNNAVDRIYISDTGDGRF